MIREVIRPSQCDFHITIPKEYIDKDVELIMFVLEEKMLKTKPDSKKEKNSLKGVFNKYADISKIPLEDGIWEKHVKDKFTKYD
jgi:hypothetical protein